MIPAGDLSWGPRTRAVATVLLVISAAGCICAQSAASPPAKILPDVVLLADSVVTNQWQHTLKLVNAPPNLKIVTPGECIRVGIFASGENHDAYLESTRLSFTAEFAGKSQAYAAAPLENWKQIKPEGGDFVTAALGSAGINNPIPTLATLGASAGKWCVPKDAQDGTVTLRAQAESPAGHENLRPATLRVESFETGSRHAFKNDKDFSEFSMEYYREPEATRLIPVLEYFAADKKLDSDPSTLQIFFAFLSAALQADPVAANDFELRIAVLPGGTKVLGLAALRSAGYEIDSATRNLGADDQQMLKKVTPINGLFDFPLDQENATYLDMMWAMFGATGNFEPVRKVASTLVWRADYEAFEKMRESGRQLSKSDLTPSVMRGLTYAAAGWSMSSFQVNDPLAADYIEYMLASSDVSDAVKSELKGLQTNPAFRERGADAK